MTNLIDNMRTDNRGGLLCVHGDNLTWTDCSLHYGQECFTAYCETCREAYPDCQLGNALKVVLEQLEHDNAHTIAALVSWTFGLSMPAPDEDMLKAYKAAQLAIFKTQ